MAPHGGILRAGRRVELRRRNGYFVALRFEMVRRISFSSTRAPLCGSWDAISAASFCGEWWGELKRHNSQGLDTHRQSTGPAFASESGRSSLQPIFAHTITTCAGMRQHNCQGRKKGMKGTPPPSPFLDALASALGLAGLAGASSSGSLVLRSTLAVGARRAALRFSHSSSSLRK
jgi:hypothetical protein